MKKVNYYVTWTEFSSVGLMNPFKFTVESPIERENWSKLINLLYWKETFTWIKEEIWFEIHRKGPNTVWTHKYNRLLSKFENNDF